MGKRTGCCPYYGARKSVEDAQLVLLPYASLLHADTRASLGVELAGAVVVIDEAHNLIDTVNETHSVTLTARQLSEVWNVCDAWNVCDVCDVCNGSCRRCDVGEAT